MVYSRNVKLNGDSIAIREIKFRDHDTKRRIKFSARIIIGFVLCLCFADLIGIIMKRVNGSWKVTADLTMRPKCSFIRVSIYSVDYCPHEKFNRVSTYSYKNYCSRGLDFSNMNIF